jgi:glutaredoxin
MAKIILYKTKNCAFCVQAKKFLDYKKVDYEEVQLEDNPQMQQALYSQGYSTVPIITNGDRVVAGYSIPKLMELIA